MLIFLHPGIILIENELSVTSCKLLPKRLYLSPFAYVIMLQFLKLVNKSVVCNGP